MSGELDDLAQSIGGVSALAAMLRRVRADRELTQEQLAARIERAPRYIARLESARMPSPTLLTVALLASACEVSVSLFVAAFALPRGEKLPWPRDHEPSRRHARTPVTGARACGAALRDERLKRHWSQADLGVRAGLTPSAVSRLERGVIAAPTLLAVTQLGRAFATSVPAQIAHSSRLAQSYAGEIDAPRLWLLQRDRREPRSDPD